MAAKQKPILYKGMGQPYLALFNFGGMPIMNPITGIPLGAYISTWSYRYDEEKEEPIIEQISDGIKSILSQLTSEIAKIFEFYVQKEGKEIKRLPVTGM